MGNSSTRGNYEGTHAELVRFVGDARAHDYAIVTDYLYPMVWLKQITVGGGRDGKPPKAYRYDHWVDFGNTPVAIYKPVDGFGPEHHVSAEALQGYPYRRAPRSCRRTRASQPPDQTMRVAIIKPMAQHTPRPADACRVNF